MINLLPHRFSMEGFVADDGEQYISISSLLLMLTEMHVANARNPDGKDEYEQIITYIKRALRSITWE